MQRIFLSYLSFSTCFHAVLTATLEEALDTTGKGKRAAFAEAIEAVVAAAAVSCSWHLHCFNL